MKTLKLFILTGFFAALCPSTKAQDFIIDKEGEAIACKVVSQTNTDVVYKTPDGKVLLFPKANILTVQYGTPTVTDYAALNAQAKAAAAQAQSSGNAVKEEKKAGATPIPTVIPDRKPITRKGTKYYVDGVRIKNKELTKLIEASDCAEAKRLMKKSRNAGRLNMFGAAFMGAGVGVGVATINGYDQTTPIIAGGVAVVGLTTVIVTSAVKNKRIRQAVEAYNGTAAPTGAGK